MCCESRHSFNLRARVRLSIPSRAIAIIFLSRPKIDAASQLTDNGEVHATAYFGLQWRKVNERIGGEIARTKVAKSLQLFPKFQQTLFRPDGACTPFLYLVSTTQRLRPLDQAVTYWSANGAEDHSISFFGGIEGFVSQRGAEAVSGLSLVDGRLRLRQMILEVAGLPKPTHAAEQVLLEIEADVWFALLKRFQNLVECLSGVHHLIRARDTFMASVVTSGPQWSPAKTTILYGVML